MNSEDLQKITDSMKSKLSDEEYAKISDDIGILITKNTQSFNESVKKDEKITKLESDKEKLVSANGNLLQQISMGEDNFSNNSKVKKEEEKKSFSFKEVFDEKGHFKK